MYFMPDSERDNNIDTVTDPSIIDTATNPSIIHTTDHSIIGTIYHGIINTMNRTNHRNIYINRIVNEYIINDIFIDYTNYIIPPIINPLGSDDTSTRICQE